jgi:HEAT repeat protein
VTDQAILLTEVVALADPVPFVRDQAAKALTAAADPKTVGSLVWALEREEQANVKLSLIGAIGEIASADSQASNRVMPALAQALKDSDSSVRSAAARELDRVTGLALGTDPTIWLRWWNEQHGEILER